VSGLAWIIVCGGIAGAVWIAYRLGATQSERLRDVQDISPNQGAPDLPAGVLALLATELAGIVSPHELLPRAGKWIETYAGVAAGIIYQFDAATNQLVDPLTFGAAMQTPPSPLKIGMLVYGQVAAEILRNRVATRHILNLDRDPYFGPHAVGMQSAYVFPLWHASQLYGVIGVQSDRPLAFSPPEQAVFDKIGNYLAVQLAGIRRHTEMQEAIDRFASYQQLAQRLTARVSTQELLREIVTAARQMLDTQMSVLLNYDEESELLTPIAWAGIADEAVKVFRTSLKQDLRGLVAWAKKPARTPNLLQDQRNVSGRDSIVAGMLSELAVPVMYLDDLYGVLAVQSAENRNFSDEEMTLLSALASQAGIALRNARLFDDLRETNHKLESTNAQLVISQQQAENARSAAVEANRLKTEFINNMSHELRTPLNAVINFTRIVSDGHAGPVNEAQIQYLGFVHESGQHLLGLINDMLDIAKIEAGKMELRLEETRLEPIFKGIMSTAIGLTRAKPISLKQEIAADLPPIRIDPTRVRQVLLNLISNAAKFTAEGSITLRAENIGPNIVISVKDTGVGINAEDLPRVFEAFMQINNPLAISAGGTGLGMPISRRFIRLHGGDMWIESQPGQGTTVFFSLPITVTEQAAG